MARPSTVVVIGAGIIGCLAARELAARDREVRITVLDRDSVGGGASRRSAGLHLPRGATARTPRMSAYSHAGRVFCDAYSPDAEPVVRELDGTGRIVFAGAANGSGYRLAPAIGSEVMDRLQVGPSEGVTSDHQYV